MNAGATPTPPRAFARRHHPRFTGGLLLLLVLWLLGIGEITPAHAQLAPAANPDLSAACGLDVILAIDESGSLQADEQTVRNSVRGLLEALSGTGSRVALVEFNLDARTPLGPAYLELPNSTDGPLGPTGALTLYLDNNYVPNGYTNWDAAFGKVAEINQAQGLAPLVIFFTDSGPNVYTNQFGSIVADETHALDEAIVSANTVKAQGSHIFVVGVGDTSAESRIVAIAGPERFPDHNQPFAQSDYTLTNFSQLTTALRQIVFSLCGPSVTLTSYANGANGVQPVAGQSFQGQVSVTSLGQLANAFVWTQPLTGAAAQVGVSQSTTTGTNGAAQWQWTPGTVAAPQPWASQFTLDGGSVPGYFFAGATCTRKTLNPAGGFTTSTFTLTTLPATFAVGPDDLITCDVFNERLALVVEKRANPTSVPESGGDVTFTFAVTNNGTAAATLTSLTDSVFGNLHNQGSCRADGTTQLAVGATYECAITKRLAGNQGTPHVNTVTASVRAANGNTSDASASATVTFQDSQPTVTLTRSVAPSALPEPGGAFTYQVQITNQSAGEELTLTALSDTPFGNLTTVGGAITATTCRVPQTLARAGTVGATYSCQFTATVTGVPGVYTDTLIAVTSDDDGNVQPFSRDQVVTISNLLPEATFQVAVTPTSRPEMGGVFTFALTITNRSAVEGITLTALNSTLEQLAATANLNHTCQLPQPLAPGAAYQCSYQALITQNSGVYAVDFSATLTDDEQSGLTLHTLGEVELTDLPAALLVTTQASQTTVAEPGADLTFVVTIKNESVVDTVTVTQVSDSIYGNLAPYCVPALPAVLDPAMSTQCQFTGPVSGAVGDLITHEVTALGIDDDGYAVSDSDLEIIEITDVPPQLDITQTARPANIPEPGGPVTMTLMIKNISPVDTVTIGKVETNEVELLVLNKESNAAVANAPTALVDISATCTPPLPVALAPGETLMCRFIKQVTGAVRGRHTSEVVVSGIDDEQLPLQQTSRETIDIIDVPAAIRITESSDPVSVPEAGAPVKFTIRVKNTSPVDYVTIQTLTSSRFGDLHTLCAGVVPTTLPPGESIICSFTKVISGDVDTILRHQTTATARDDDGQTISDSTQSAIGITDTPATLKITQLAEPSGVAEPGGMVTFTMTIRNSSPVDEVTIHQVEDSHLGDISAGCLPKLPTTLAPGAQMSCRFSHFVGGNATTVDQRMITVTGIDDDAVIVRDFDVIAVDVLDVAPMATMNATATPNQILESGGLVTMTVTIVNEGPEVTMVTALTNTLAGELNGVGTCTLPQALAANGGTYTCTFARLVEGVATAPPRNLFTATIADDDGNRRQITDKAEIFLVAVTANVQTSKDDALLIDRFIDPADEGKVSPGDTLRYTIRAVNTGNGAGGQVVLSDEPDPNTRLVAGSVTTSKGQILLGNGATDTELLVVFGELAIGESATVTFDVFILEGTGTTLLRNQAEVSYTTIFDPGGASRTDGSDDPSTLFRGDPTDTRVFIPPTNLAPDEEPTLRTFYLPLIQQ